MTPQFSEFETINNQELQAAAGGGRQDCSKNHRTRQSDQPFVGDIPLQNLDQCFDWKIMVA